MEGGGGWRMRIEEGDRGLRIDIERQQVSVQKETYKHENQRIIWRLSEALET